ncbi:MAG: penicillin-binding protein activator [Desulfovermiculus sp.]|nr:penicillin-binding protein activator [Desulfovermiculus sp.]
MFLSLLFTGCARLSVPLGPEPDAARILSQAEQSWQQGNTHQAEELYAQAVDLKGLSRKERIQAWQGLARAAQANEHWGVAVRALGQWADMDPTVRRDWPWQSRYLDVLSVWDREAWQEQATGLIQDSQTAWSVKVQTARHVVRELIQSQRADRAWSWLEALYQQASGQNQRQELEEETLDLLRSLGDRSWVAVLHNPPSQESFVFFLVRWVQAGRDLENNNREWPEVWSELARMVKESELAISKRLGSELAQMEEEYGPPTRAVALLCPLSGDFSDMGWKIALGASVAQWQLELAGEDMDLYVLNSGAPDWMRRLEALPEEFRLIGGPLRKENWEHILENSHLRRRTFFPFRSTLDPDREGVDGFRFFPGTQDQIRPLVQLMQEAFGIRDYAVLHPNSEYGYRLSAAFDQVLERGYGRVGALENYDSRRPETWKKVVAGLLGVDGRAQKTGDDSIPTPGFQAVFLPDSFSQVQMLIPEFFYFDQDQLFFLGPILWSQGLKDIAKLDRKYFRLALMTTPWLSNKTSSAAEELSRGLGDMNEGEPDFWVALGYDFVRLAHKLEQSLRVKYDGDVAAALGSLQDFTWSMAPMSWDGQGRARQELFVVQPAGNGVRPVSVDELKDLWDAARNN